MKPIFKDSLIILLIGFTLRVIIGTFTLNWDFLRITQITAKIFTAPISDIYKDPLSLYPVLTYWTRYAFILLTKPFLTINFFPLINQGDMSFISSSYIFRFLFILKLPFILLELFTAYIFSKLFVKEAQNKILLSWMLNGVALYTIAAFTNVDVFPVFFIVLAVYFFR